MNRAKTNFTHKLKKYFDDLPFDISGKNLCVCLSGGADSVSLLKGLLLISKEYNFSVSACHFNHGIRGIEADNDELFCKELCKESNIKIYCGRDDVPAFAKLHKLSLEDAARKCRYSFFERVISKNSVDFCVTAHNMNDDAETLLYNLIRGAGSNGASAILPYSETVLRPILKVSRSEVEEFLKEIQQPFVTDSTNLSDDYTRNYIRHNIIPLMSNVNPSVVESLSRFIDSSRCDRNYFDEIVNGSLNTDLRLLHKSVRDRVILKKYKEFSGKILNNDLMLKLESSLFENHRCIVPLQEAHEALVFDGKIVFVRQTENSKFFATPVPLTIGDNFLFDNRVIIKYTNENSFENINKLSTTDIVSFDNIVGAVYIRNRREGDKITVRGVNKSLKKLFIDMKIPKEYRDIIPVLYDDEGIIYVPFVAVSDRIFNKKTNNKVFLTTVLNSVDKERWQIAHEK